MKVNNHGSNNSPRALFVSFNLLNGDRVPLSSATTAMKYFLVDRNDEQRVSETCQSLR